MKKIENFEKLKNKFTTFLTENIIKESRNKVEKAFDIDELKEIFEKNNIDMSSIDLSNVLLVKATCVFTSDRSVGFDGYDVSVDEVFYNKEDKNNKNVDEFIVNNFDENKIKDVDKYFPEPGVDDDYLDDDGYDDENF